MGKGVDEPPVFEFVPVCFASPTSCWDIIRVRVKYGWILVLLAVSRLEGAEQLVERESLYNTILTEKTGTVVEMRFRRRGTTYMETAVDVADPLNLLVPYTRTLFVAEAMRPSPRTVLMIGLGGGAFNRLFNAAYPDAVLTTAELDQVVADLAAEHMGFRQTEKNRVVVADGRTFLRKDASKYDWIILDAFRGGYAPSHLKTREFYEDIRAHLAPGGVFLTNLHSTSELFDSDLATLRAVFPQVLPFVVANSRNVVAVASAKARPLLTDQLAGMERTNSVLAGRLDWEGLRAEARPDLGPGPKAQVLTDDFAPVEFLDAVKRKNEPRP